MSMYHMLQSELGGVETKAFADARVLLAGVSISPAGDLRYINIARGLPRGNLEARLCNHNAGDSRFPSKHVHYAYVYS